MSSWTVSLAGELLGHHPETFMSSKSGNHIRTPNVDTEYLNSRPTPETVTYAGRRDDN